MKRVYLKLSELTGHHGNCDKCGLFGRLHDGYEDDDIQLCPECFTETYEAELEQEAQKKHTEVKEKRLAIKFEETIKKRIEKGWCPIKIRH